MSSTDEDVPLKRIKNESDSDEYSNVIKKTPKKVKKESDEDIPLAKSKAKSSRVKKEKTTPKRTVSIKESPKKSPKKEEEEEEEYKWWLEENRDDTIKWNTLSHNGVCFPPDYVPHGVKMRYKGKEVELSANSEEVASFYAALIGTDWVKNDIFTKNFFNDFMQVLRDNDPTCPIQKFEDCDFTPITEYLEKQKEIKKAMTKEQKQKVKEEKQKIDDHYGFAYLDGRKEKVGNFRIEPPGLFKGRGEHPKTGSLKTRVAPEQITINIGQNDPVPAPPAGHSWGEVVHDNKVTWLAYWKENVNENFKYVFLAANSSLKGQSDFKKFEKARELKHHINRIRNEYTDQLKDKQMVIRQRATALHLIDRFALRAGNEKGDDEADTVGCCSLRFEHISLEPPNKVIFDFLGKDSIRYYNEVEVDDQVFKNLKIFKREPKAEGDLLFDRLTTGLLNKYLSGFMAGLSAKVFRTYNASITFQSELLKTPKDGTVAEQLLAYNRANRQVAILCNHQRAVTKGHGNQMMKLKDKILGLKYERQNIAEQMLELEPSLSKTRPELADPESEVDEEFIQRYLEMVQEKDAKALAAKLVKENEKRRENGEEEITEMDIDQKPKKPILDMEKLEKKYEQFTGRIEALKTNLIDKDENKTTALGTSKINYIDPRISASWCKKYDVPIEKIFAKTLREKFKWAMDMEPDWKF